MIEPLVLGSLLGIFSGLVPGPFSTLIAATALRSGFRAGFWIAVVPLVSEVAVLALTAAFLSRLPEDALGWMGMAGGVLVLSLAWRTFRESREPPRAEPLEGSTTRILQGALLAVLSPAPWVFWLLVGSPLFLAAWRRGWAAGSAFLGSFLFWLVGIHLAIAAAAAFGHRRLEGRRYRRVMVGVALALAGAGVVLLWQSWVGNFQEMVAGTDAVRGVVEDRLP